MSAPPHPEAGLPAGTLELQGPVLICPDLHDHPERLGHLQARLRALRSDEPELRLVLLGDVIDRGQAAAQTFSYARTEVEAGRAVWLSGNHELMAACSLLGGAEAALLTRVWKRVGGDAWTAQLGAPAAREALHWMRRHLALAASLPGAGPGHPPGTPGRTLLTHADVPDQRGWALIAEGGARHSDGVARLGDIDGPDALEGAEGRTGFVWSWPGPSGWPGVRQARGHLSALHGHVPRDAPVSLVPHSGHPGGWALDLKSPARLATVHVDRAGEWRLMA